MATRKVKTIKNTKKTTPGWMDRFQSDVQRNNSILNLILGALILVVLGILIFNYFNRGEGDLGPAQQTDNQQAQLPEFEDDFEDPEEPEAPAAPSTPPAPTAPTAPTAAPQTPAPTPTLRPTPQPTAVAQQNNNNKVADAAKDKLPGKYTVKAGDTLFSIAQNYYGDGYQFSKIAQDNKLNNPNTIEIGQVLNISKLETKIAQTQPTPQAQGQVKQQAPTNGQGTGGAINQTAWGEKITGNTYIIQEGDWLSTIAGRAYGDILAYERIAKANNIANPNVIEPGRTINLPR